MAEEGRLDLLYIMKGLRVNQNTEIYLVLIVHRFHHHSHTDNQGWTILLLTVKYRGFA